MLADNKPKPEAIQVQLERILQSAKFRASDKQSSRGIPSQ
jgi:hypothetical protein